MLLPRWTTLVCHVAAILLCFQGFTFAADSEDAPSEGSFAQSARVRRSRIAEAAFKDAQTHLAKKEYSSAFERLRSILDLESDVFIDVNGIQSSLQLQANHLLSSLPIEKLKLYEVQFGRAAEQKLEIAHDAGGREPLLYVATLYLQTRAGFAALQELSAWEFDRGHFPEAIAGYQAVIRHPLARSSAIWTAVVKQTIALMRIHEFDRARELITRYKRLLSAKTVAAPDGENTFSDWLQEQLDQFVTSNFATTVDWRMERGSSRRNRISQAETPSMIPVWQRDIRPGEDEASLIGDALAELREQGVARLSTLSPIVVDNVVIARTVDQLMAFDLPTGKMLWQNKSGLRTTGASDNSRMLQNAGFRALFSETLVRQLQSDTIFGTLSSDGDYVFSVESELMNGSTQLKNRTNNSRSNAKKGDTSAVNQLVAYSVRLGELKWRIGGPKVKDQYSGMTFLGPPLPYDGILYVLCQKETEIQLLAIQPNDGRLQWSVLLAETPRTIANDLRRRGRSCPVAAKDGLLICPTAAGAVVAVDMLTRKPIWAYRYERDDIQPVSRRQPARLNRNLQDRWWDGWREVATVIDNDSVFVVTPESNAIHGLDIQTGRVIWKQPRENGLFLAGSFGAHLLVVEEDAVRSLDVKTGQSEWRSKLETVGGRGFGTNTHYHLPVSRGGIAVVDLTDGAVRQTFPAAIENPGNLVVVNGGILAQSESRIAFHSSIDDARAAVAKRLSVSPDDVDASIENALIERESGNFTESETILRRLQSRKGSEQALDLLRETLLIHLREHPDSHAEISAQLSTLIETTMHRIDYLHGMAIAMRELGEYRQSLETYLELLGLNPSGDFSGLDSSSRTVKFNRQLQGEIADLFSAAKSSERAELESIFDRAFQSARDNQDPFALQRFADRYEQLHWGKLAYAKLASRSGIGVGFLKSQLKLLEISQFADRDLAASGLKQFAELMDARSFRADSAAAYRLLRDRFADVRLEDGKTAAEAIAELPKDSLLTDAVIQGLTDRWPASKPEVTTVKRRKRASEFYPVAVEADRDSLFDRMSVYVDRQGTRVRFQGDQHHGPWELKLPATKSPFRYMYPLHHGWGMGHLLVLRIGTDLYGISPLNDNGEPIARLAWVLDTMGGHLPKLNQLGVRTIDARRGFGVQEIMLLDSYGQPLANVGPVGPGYLCYRQKGKLIAVETATGASLWQRFGLPAETIVSGDSQNVLLTSPDSSRLEIIRAIDGKTVAVRTLKTKPREFLQQTGRYALTQEEKAEQLVVRRTDLIDGRLVWERSFSKGTSPFAIDRERLGAVESDDQLHIFSSITGETLFTNRVEMPEQLMGLYAIADSHRFYVAVSGQLGPQVNQKVNRIRGGYRNPLVNGRLYAFHRQTGEKVWQRDLKDMAFPLDQPIESPLFLLYSGKQSEGKGDKEEFVGVVELLDKRTGEPIHQISRVRGGQAIDLNANVEQAVVEIGTAEEQVRIQFEK